MKIFETFKCSDQILSNSLCQIWNEKSIPFQILYPSSVSWNIIPLYFFSSNNTYFAQKELIKMKIFETFECSGQILSNSLCQFWNGESIPLQIWDPSSVSWKITPLYFFSSNNIYFAQKEPIKMKIFETFECSGQILSNSLCQFWNDESIPLQILYPSSVWWRITPLYFFSSNNIYFAQKEPVKMKIFETFECLGVFCQIPYANFETTTRFLSKFCIPLQFHEKLLLCTFLVQAIYTLLIRSPLKWKSFRLPSAQVKFDKILMPIFKGQVDSSPNFVSLFTFVKDNSSVLF